MVLAILAAAGCVALALPPSSSRRARALLGARRPDRRLDVRGAGLLVVPVVAVVVLGAGVGLPVGIGAALVARRVLTGAESPARRRDRERARAQLPRALDLVVAALEAGRPADAALELVAAVVDPPVAAALADVAARLRTSPDPRLVWDHVAQDPLLGAMGRAFRRADTSGMPVARVVHEVAAEERRADRARRRERGRRVAVRTAAPLGACFLPAFFLVGVVPTLVGVFTGLDLGLG